MTTKKSVPVRTRVQAAAKRHPLITLASVATAVSLLATLGPSLWWATHYYETREDAAQSKRELQALILDSKRGADRNLAWMSVQSIKTEITVWQNRINDCDIREEKKDRMSALERQTCAQYRANLSDAMKRFDTSRSLAMTLSSGTTHDAPNSD